MLNRLALETNIQDSLSLVCDFVFLCFYLRINNLDCNFVFVETSAFCVTLRAEPLNCRVLLGIILAETLQVYLCLKTTSEGLNTYEIKR